MFDGKSIFRIYTAHDKIDTNANEVLCVFYKYVFIDFRLYAPPRDGAHNPDICPDRQLNR